MNMISLNPTEIEKAISVPFENRIKFLENQIVRIQIELPEFQKLIARFLSEVKKKHSNIRHWSFTEAVHGHILSIEFEYPDSVALIRREVEDIARKVRLSEKNIRLQINFE